MRKLTCPPGTETVGLLLGGFADNIQGDETRPIMEKHGMVNLEPHTWYPVKMLLDALNELAEKASTTPAFVAIGLTIGEGVPLPADIENPTLEDVLMAWNNMYQDLHRGGDVGSILIEKISDTHFKVALKSMIYPDDMNYGVLYAYGRRMLPPGTAFNVYYDPDVTPLDQGGEGDTTYIHIQWE